MGFSGLGIVMLGHDFNHELKFTHKASSGSRRMATFLQTLKETFADPGEILKLEWKDIKDKVISINHPVKRHNAGQVRISNRLLAMLMSLPRTSTKVFPITYHNAYHCFYKLRQRVAKNMENPRFLQMSFRSFRHWGGTITAYSTNGNVLEVQRRLRHKSILSSMKYIHMILDFQNDECDVTTTTTVEEAKKILAIGFQFVLERDGTMIFKKPKRFGT